MVVKQFNETAILKSLAEANFTEAIAFINKLKERLDSQNSLLTTMGIKLQQSERAREKLESKLQDLEEDIWYLRHNNG